MLRNKMLFAGMMGVGINGMAGSPAQGNFMQQVSPSSENNLDICQFTHCVFKFLGICIDKKIVFPA